MEERKSNLNVDELSIGELNTSELSFSEPQRQSQAALVLIIYNRFKNLISRFWYFIVFFLFTGKSDGGFDTFTIGIIGLTLLATILSILSYFRYYYWIEDDQLMIRSGVLSKSLTQIPFDRIQTIDYEQNLIHQMLNVVGLKIDTAGSSQAETKMQALTKNKADALRNFILSQKKETLIAETGDEKLAEAQLEEAEEIYKIDLGRLIKIGLTENHLRSGFVFLFGAFWFFDNIRETGVDVDELGVEYYNMALGSLLIIGTLAILFVIISMVISISRVFLKYYNLSFLRSFNGFKVIGGLFNRKEVAALDTKIQLLEWKQNLIQKYLGFHDLVLKQASSSEVGSKKSIVVPGVYQDDIENVKNYLFPDRNEDVTEMHQLNKWSLYRPLIYITILALLLVVLFIYTDSYYNLFALSTFYILVTIRLFKKYEKAYYGINDKAIFVKGGVFGHKKWMTMHHKIQSMQISQSPFQVRRDLASLSIHTASGTKTIPFIELARAEYLYDYLTYKVEIAEEEWM